MGELSFARARAEDSLAALLDAERGSVAGVEVLAGGSRCNCGCGSCWGSAWVAMVGGSGQGRFDTESSR